MCVLLDGPLFFLFYSVVWAIVIKSLQYVHVFQYLMLWSLIVVSEGKKVNWEPILCLPYVQDSGVLLSYINLYIQ